MILDPIMTNNTEGNEGTLLQTVINFQKKILGGWGQKITCWYLKCIIFLFIKTSIKYNIYIYNISVSKWG